MKPLISVIVPVFNVADHLPKCINSLLNQRYSNLEILLVDDGSTDGSSDICDQFATDARIKVIHQQHTGVAHARNTGLRNATGTFIGFLDGDDYLHRDCFDYLYQILVKHDADLVSCAYLKVYGDEAEDLANRQLDQVVIEEVSGRYMLEHLRDSRYYPANTVLGSKLYRKELWEGLQFETGKLHEDEYIIHKIYYRANRLCLSPLQLYFYVQRKGSIMRINKNQRFDDVRGVYIQRIRFFEQLGETRFRHQAELHELLTLLDFHINHQNKSAAKLLREKRAAYDRNPLISKKYLLLLQASLLSRFLGRLLMKFSDAKKKF